MYKKRTLLFLVPTHIPLTRVNLRLEKCGREDGTVSQPTAAATPSYKFGNSPERERAVLLNACGRVHTDTCVCPRALSRVQLFATRGLEPARLLSPWTFAAKNTEVDCHFLLRGIFLTQGLNLHLLHWQAYSLLFWHQEAHTYWNTRMNFRWHSFSKVSFP